MSTEASGAPRSIKSCAVVEKPAVSQERVKCHPVAVRVGLADVKAFKFITCSFGMKLKTFDALTNLETIISHKDDCC